MSQGKTLRDRMAAAAQLMSKARKEAGAAAQPATQPEFVRKLLEQLGVSVPGLTGQPVARNSQNGQNSQNSENSENSQASGAGRFLSKSYANEAGSRTYKLYIPSTYSGQPMPLMVMLHGCTQNPDDFSAGTQMNIVAEEKQCFVAYPAQEPSANMSKCWNWFKAIDQQRGQGEPSLIAGITEEIIAEYGLDRDRVYVAGMSAGGAMAVIMGTTYPDLYKAVGVHSGLPYAAADDLPSAMSAMRGVAAKRARAKRGSPQAAPAVPIIVFHGDSDPTVNAANGDRVINDYLHHAEKNADAAMHVIVEDGGEPGRRTYTRISHHAGNQPASAEHWVIHGAGHAWAGGSADGSYTDASGPDASREMLRFFYTQSSETVTM